MGAIGSPTEATSLAAKPITKLVRVGGKLAVLGMFDGATTTEQARWWHVVKPGTAGAVDVGTRLAHARSFCGLLVATNGYASDFTPPDGTFCPRCREQV